MYKSPANGRFPTTGKYPEIPILGAVSGPLGAISGPICSPGGMRGERLGHRRNRRPDHWVGRSLREARWHIASPLAQSSEDAVVTHDLRQRISLEQEGEQSLLERLAEASHFVELCGEVGVGPRELLKGLPEPGVIE
jgi:hypothetical protein